MPSTLGAEGTGCVGWAPPWPPWLLPPMLPSPGSSPAPSYVKRLQAGSLLRRRSLWRRGRAAVHQVLLVPQLAWPLLLGSCHVQGAGGCEQSLTAGQLCSSCWLWQPAGCSSSRR